MQPFLFGAGSTIVAQKTGLFGASPCFSVLPIFLRLFILRKDSRNEPDIASRRPPEDAVCLALRVSDREELKPNYTAGGKDSCQQKPRGAWSAGTCTCF